MMKEYPNLPLIQERFWNAIKDLDVIQNTKYYPELYFSHSDLGVRRLRLNYKINTNIQISIPTSRYLKS